VSRDILLQVDFRESASTLQLTTQKPPFGISTKIREDFRSSRLTAGVKDFFTPTVSCYPLANLPAVSAIPEAILQKLSKTLVVVNNDKRYQHIYTLH
jgi:hypothetical protein